MFARNLLLVFLVSSMLMFKLGSHWMQAAHTTKIAAQNAAQRATQKQALATTLAKHLDETPKSEPLPIEHAVAAAMFAIHQQAIESLVSIQQTNNVFANGTSENLQLTRESTKALGDTELRVANIRVTGTYKTLEGIQDFTQKLNAQGVGVAAVKLEQNGFNLLIRVIGA